MFFREAPEWLQQVLRQLSRDGYIYIGRTGVGLSYAFRKAPACGALVQDRRLLILSSSPGASPFNRCYRCRRGP